nr:MAG TPA_asm: hypothetical protein [Caudoviricetes sp.]
MCRKAATEAGARCRPIPAGVPHFYKHFFHPPFFVKNKKKNLFLPWYRK